MQKNPKNNYYIVAGPSGVGKGTLVSMLQKDLPNVVTTVSYTTREKREGEENGVQYFFVTKEEFKKMIEDEQFLEYSEHFGNLYGTSKKQVFDHIAEGKIVISEIDVDGFKQIKSRFPECIGIFILPPSIDDLRERLIARGTESPEKIQTRLQRAEYEISNANLFDFRVVNDYLDKSYLEFRKVFV